MRMTSVTPEALAAMNAQGERCAAELADAECDVLAYACLVAVMAAGPGAHRDAENRLRAAAGGTPVVTSAGALIDGIQALGAERVAIIAPYAPALTAKVVRYLADAGIEVVDTVSLNVTDNRVVGRLDPRNPLRLLERLDLRRAEALVVSACVQMPSLAAIEVASDLTAHSLRGHRDGRCPAGSCRPGGCQNLRPWRERSTGTISAPGCSRPIPRSGIFRGSCKPGRTGSGRGRCSPATAVG
jgi:maleate cis-trans isomerase